MTSHDASTIFLETRSLKKAHITMAASLSGSRLLPVVLLRHSLSRRRLGASGLASVWQQKCFSSPAWSDAISTRQLAELEDVVHAHVSKTVRDPILQSSLADLQWLNRRIAVSENNNQDSTTLQLHLRLPSLLHPDLAVLKESISHSAKEVVDEWLRERSHEDKLAVNVNVEAIATTPVPMMARLSEDRDDLLKSLGPGLANVAHYVAVYSCKVRIHFFARFVASKVVMLIFVIY